MLNNSLFKVSFISRRVHSPSTTILRFKSLIKQPLNLNRSMEKSYSKCQVAGLDHLVLTVADMEKSINFYTNALGMGLVTFGEGRKALKFGNQKINLHQQGQEFKPHAKNPAPGSADVCFVSHEPLTNWISQLQRLSIPIEEGPVKRTGAVGPITSIYVRDPDGNLVEIANYEK